MRKLFLLAVLVATTSLAYGQKQADSPCEYPIYPVSRAGNKPPVPPSYWIAPQSAVVGVDVTVDPSGNVKDAVVVYSGGRDADDAVLQVIRKWTYSPAMCGSKPVQIKIHVKLNLQLGKAAK